jgi:hypothetical protein
MAPYAPGRLPAGPGRSPRSTLAYGLGAALLGLGATACSSDSNSAVTEAPTQIAISPESFLGDVACSSETGGLQAYVVTLDQWADASDTTPFTLGSSFPTTCARAIVFRDVLVAGTFYTAEIDGYEQPAEQLSPFGGASSGSRQMLSVGAEQPIAPRWRTRCGHDGSDATPAIPGETHFVTGCAPLSDDAPSTTMITFPPSAALGAEPCATAPSMDIEPEGSSLAPLDGVACDAAPVVYAQGIVDGQAYYFYVTADADGVALGTECFVTARAGLSGTPLCNAISAEGDLSVSLDGLYVGDRELCPLTYGFDVALDGDVLNAEPLPCGTDAHVGPLPSGDTTLDITVLDDLGQPTGNTATCTATVLPGKTVQTLCLVP